MAAKNLLFVKKSTFTIALFAVAAIIGMSSCEKLDFSTAPPDDVFTTSTVHVTINQNEEYTYTVPSFSSDCVTGVSRQPRYFSKSLVLSNASGQSVYHFQPSTAYLGLDTVELTTKGTPLSGSGGADPNDPTGTIHEAGTQTMITTMYIKVIKPTSTQ